MVHEVKFGLRLDVAELVGALIREASLLDPRSQDLDFHYVTARREINQLCGWDAPIGKYDQCQYERALKIYVEGAEA